MKRWLIAVTCLLACLCWSGWIAAGAEETVLTEGDFSYVVLEDGTARIQKYSGEADALTIPSELGGYRVTAIGDSAFARHGELAEVVIPQGVTAIGDSAFEGCYSLVKADIPDSVTSIGDFAFWSAKFTRVSFPDGLTRIGCNPFVACENLTEFELSKDHPVLELVDGVLFSKPDGRLVCYPVTLMNEHYAIPEGTAIIDDLAFMECDLVHVTIPDGVTKIGQGAFNHSELLSGIIIPDSVTEIGDSSFYGCSSLAYARLPRTLEFIDIGVFSHCESLVWVTLPDGLTRIEEAAFYRCDSLIGVDIPDSVTAIGRLAFGDCGNLLYVTVPSGAAEVDETAFDGCDRLTP